MINNFTSYTVISRRSSYLQEMPQVGGTIPESIGNLTQLEELYDSHSESFDSFNLNEL